MTALFLLPVALGLIGTWLPAFGYFPAIGANHFTLEPWQQLFEHPSFQSAFLHTLVSGLGGSALALVLLLILLIGAYPSRLFSWIERVLSPILSVPHAAFAIGLGFLLTPSGWLIRIVDFATGWFPLPPQWTAFQDPIGFSLMLTLAAKELPFLLFMSLAVLPTLKTSKTIWLANSMGLSRRFAWLWLIAPQLYRQIKLPIFAVFVYSLTVVDIALIAGPTTPPTLAVLITQLFNDPDLIQRTVGAAGATSLLLIVVFVIVGLYLLEKPLCLLRNKVIIQGRGKPKTQSAEKWLSLIIAALLGSLYLGSFITTTLWSFAHRWRYPSVLPEQFSTKAWSRIFQRIDEPFWCTFLLATLAATIAIILVTLALENEVRLKRAKKSVNSSAILWLIYLPLLIPQIAFIFGFQVSLIQAGLDGLFISLLWSHLVFVVPYVFLTLSGPYRKYNERFSWQALALSQNRNSVYWRVKFPMLMRPFFYAFATGFSVSIAQYLPTLFIGAGKFTTITTEAVAMTSGSDRRLMAVMAIWQQSLPLLVFGLATLIPMIRFRNRLAMKY
jgi:putative thiamine transport system permease protein